MSRLFSGTPFDKPATCRHCHQTADKCRCQPLPEKKKMGKRSENQLSTGLVIDPTTATPPADQVARIRLEKRKGNREATVITGLEHPANDLAKLCTDLKTVLGTGGSVQGRTVELQGDHTAAVEAALQERGMKVRLA